MLNDLYEHINSFTYRGRNSLDFGLVVESKTGVYGAPVPIVETVRVPGRGTLILNNKVDPLDNEEYEDIEIRFTCHVLPDPEQDLHILARKIYAWLYGNVEFARLEDTYEPNYYREAYIGQQSSVEDVAAALAGKIEIPFTCRAFKRHVAGDEVITLTAAGKVFNHEQYTSKPAVTLYGSGSAVLYINDRQISITGIDGHITLDSELFEAHKDGTRQNTALTSQVFPRLVSGVNEVSWAGNVTRVEIIPRWVSL